MSFGFLTKKEILDIGPTILKNDFNKKNAEAASYRLCLGDEVYISGQDYPKHLSVEDPYVSLPRGQFALLMTKEYITMPKDILGLISIRLGKKEQGLINISGFHVDPDFQGKLMFSVFNAGPLDVVLKYDDDMFVIFFFRLEHDVDITDEPEHKHAKQEHLPINTVTSLKGSSASLADVDRRVSQLETREKVYWALLLALVSALVAFFLKYAK